MIPSELSKKSWELIFNLYKLPDVTNVVSLNGDDNRVYKMSIPESADRVLRVSHPDTGTNQKILSEFLVLKHLRQNTDLNVPSPIRDKHGRFFTTIFENDGSGPWQVSMLSYLDGEVLSGKQLTSDSMFLIGRTLGQLDIALEKADKAIKPTPSKIRVRRDGKEIIKWALVSFSQEHVDGIFLNTGNSEKSLHPTFSKIISRLQSGCKKLKRSLPHQLLHLDAHPDNLIYDGLKIGILDFENMAYGPRIYELAAPFHTFYELDGSKKMGNSPNGLAELIKAILAGYESYIPLSQTELKGFPLFRALRLFAGLSWAVGRQNLPAWKKWLKLNSAATVHHIIALLDEYESDVIDKRFFVSKMGLKKKEMTHSRIKVSVLMLAYNQEPYIAQAINSVLMQETDFGYEIVIGEDCSTDGTREILIDYQKKHPDKIRLLLHEKNMGANANYRKTYSECNGRYIAYLEGDDFWIDRKKLQKQVALLDKNKELSMCFTGARKITENGSVIQDNMVAKRYRTTLTQREILSGFVPPALTVLMRRYPLVFPDCSHRIVNQDFFEFVMITEFGNAGYLPEITSCSRMHSGGIWSMKSEEYYFLNGLELSEALLEHFGWKYKYMLLSKVRWQFRRIIRFYKKKRMRKKLFWVCLRLIKYLIRCELKYRISWALGRSR